MKDDRPSTTARVIAAATILLSRRRGDILAPKLAVTFCRRFLSHHWTDRLLAFSASTFAGRAFWSAVEAMTLPGIVDHYWYRKRMIEEECRKAIDQGYQQVIVLGAGLDTLTFRLDQESLGLRLCEYDHPATQRLKMGATREVEGECRIQFFPVDLAADTGAWPRLIKEEQGSVVIAEGLLMYFTPDRIKEILQWLCTSLAGSPCILIATYMEQRDDLPAGFRPRSRLVDWWLGRRSEPFLWSIHPDALAGFLSDAGYRLDRHVAGIDLPAYLNRPPGPHRLRGENVFVARGKD